MIQAAETVVVLIPIDGRISMYHVEVGDEVYEGQLLAEIRSEDAESAKQAVELELERAQSRVTNLEATLSAARLEASRAEADASRVRSEFERSAKVYERQKILIAEGATPRRVFEKAEQEYRALEDESASLSAVAKQAVERVSTTQRDLDAAKKLLDGRNEDLEEASGKLAAGQVVSPADGVVAARRGQEGDEVHPAMEDLLRIATDLSKLEVVAEADSAQAARIKAGQQAAVIVADLPGEVLGGVVKIVEGGKVTVEFGNPSAVVKPGLTAQVRIKVT
jgi:multidrug resistance efflux pump